MKRQLSGIDTKFKIVKDHAPVKIHGICLNIYQLIYTSSPIGKPIIEALA